MSVYGRENDLSREDREHVFSNRSGRWYISFESTSSRRADFGPGDGFVGWVVLMQGMVVLDCSWLGMKVHERWLLVVFAQLTGAYGAGPGIDRGRGGMKTAERGVKGRRSDSWSGLLGQVSCRKFLFLQDTRTAGLSSRRDSTSCGRLTL